MSSVSLDTSTLLGEFFNKFHLIVCIKCWVFSCCASSVTSLNYILEVIFLKRETLFHNFYFHHAENHVNMELKKRTEATNCETERD